MIARIGWILLLPGCLLLESPPPQCIDEECPHGFRCERYSYMSDDCMTSCFDDSDCQSGWYCCDDYDYSCYDRHAYDCVEEGS